MIDVFSIHLVLAFIVGGISIAVTTVAADRFGSKIGGFVGGLPLVIVVSLFFIGLNQSASAASLAANVVPVAQGIDGLFLVAYALAARKGFLLGLFLALVVWSVLATTIALFGIHNLTISFLLYLPILLFSYYILEMKLKLKSRVGIKMTYTIPRVLGRTIFGGLMIAFAVFISQYGGPTLGGIFSVFPAVYISTIILTNLSGGIEFSRIITKPLVVSGLINIVFYAIAVSRLFPVFGIWVGTIGAYLITLPIAYVTYLFIQKKLR